MTGPWCDAPAAFRKKPVVIQAMRFDGSRESAELIIGWAQAQGVENVTSGVRFNAVAHTLIIPTLEGDHRADAGDWIIQGVAGEFYPCKPDIFDASYEAANSPGLQQASRAMLDALEGLEAWDDDLGSRSVSEAVWTARDSLRAALSGSQKEPT